MRADNLFRGGREQIGGLFFKRRAFDRCGFRSLSEQISSLFVVRFLKRDEFSLNRFGIPKSADF